MVLKHSVRLSPGGSSTCKYTHDAQTGQCVRAIVDCRCLVHFCDVSFTQIEGSNQGSRFWETVPNVGESMDSTSSGKHRKTPRPLGQSIPIEGLSDPIARRGVVPALALTVIRLRTEASVLIRMVAGAAPRPRCVLRLLARGSGCAHGPPAPSYRHGGRPLGNGADGRDVHSRASDWRDGSAGSACV